MKDLVTVIMPCYNDEGHILETVSSVLNQSYRNIEFLVIDDCSTDGTLDVLNSVRDPRLKILRNSMNRGGAFSRNRGLDNATGKWVAFVDSDDLWMEDKLVRQLDFMESKYSDFCYTLYTVIDEKGKFLSNCDKMPASINYRKLLKHCYPRMSSVIVRRSEVLVCARFPDLKKRQDYGYFLNLLRKIDSAILFNEYLCSYRIRQGSVSSSKLQNIPYHWSLFYNVEKLGLLYSSFLMLFWFGKSGMMNFRRLIARATR